MKIEKHGTVGIIFLFLISLAPAFAIDGLQISVPSTNAILSWPSLTNETYVIEYRETFSTNDTWTTLDGNLMATDGTNITTFTDPNSINFGTVGDYGTNDGGGIGLPSPGDTNDADGNTGTNGVPGTGFYRVLDVRVIGGLTNGMTASGYINVAVRPESGANYLDLLMNGQTYPNQSLLTPPFTDTNSITFEDVDTCYLTNGGSYTLQVEGGWYLPSEANMGSGYEIADSQSYSIYVTNELSYPAWNGDAGDGWASFDVQSAHPDVNWEIDIYNYYDYLYWYYGYTNTVTPIQIVTGTTTNGLIDYDWDLTDDVGNVRTNLTTDPAFFTFTYTTWTGNGGLGDALPEGGAHPNDGGGGGSAQVANPIIQNDVWPSSGGYWVTAYQDMFRNCYDSGGLMPTMLNDWLDQASTVNSVFYQTPTSGTNAQTWPIRYNAFTNTAFVNTNSYYNPGILYDDELLNSDLHDSRARNFYGYGHGGSDIFMGLQLAEVNVTPMHRYRFVWLDGCNTAKGGWDRAFHINGPGTYPLSYYQSVHRRPALFVGHTQEIPYGRFGGPEIGGVQYDGTIPSSVPYFRSNILFYWAEEYGTFYESVNYSEYETPAIEPPIVFTSGPLKGQGYQPGDDMQIEGYEDIGFDQYNDLTDLPW
jgi:hypothetical protein